MPDKPIPKSEAELVIFLPNFIDKLNQFGSLLGITPAEIAQMEAHVANLTYLVTITKNVQDTREAFTDFKTTIINGDLNEPDPQVPVFPSINLPEAMGVGVVPYTRHIAQRLKSSIKWTEQLAEEFGLWTDNPSPDPESNLPVLSGSALPTGDVEIKFRKHGRQGIILEMRKRGEETWTNMGLKVTSPTIISPKYDTNEPQVLEFRCRYAEKDQPVGPYSQILTVVTTP